MTRVPSHAPLEALTGSGWATVPEVLAARAKATPDAPYLVQGEQRWSFHETLEVARRFAGFLAAEGLAGERVATLLPKTPHIPLSWYGANIAGGPFIGLNHAQRGELLTDLLVRSRASVLVTDCESFALLDVEAQPVPRLVLFTDELPPGAPPAGQRWRTWQAVMEAAPGEVVAQKVSDPTVLLFTSGTTGRSKLVPIPHAMYTRGAGILADTFGYRADDVIHDWMPMSHVSGQLHVTLSALVAGSALALFPTFSRHSFWDEVRDCGATVCGGFANVVYLLSLAAPLATDRDHKLRIGMIANNTPKAKADFEARFGMQLLDSYGMSECEPLTLPVAGTEEPPGACGLINPDFEIAILHSETDQPLPLGEVGRIAVRPRGPHIMVQGYEGDPAETVAVWQNLWFHTQDLGRRDAEGYLYFVDRLKNAIRRGGENIAAVDVEKVIKTHPAVADCGVTGVEDPVVGQEIKAVIVLVPGAVLEPQALHAFARERMAAYMAPRYIEQRSELAYTELGKIRRETLGEVKGPLWDARQPG